MIKYATNLVVAIGAGLTMVWIAGCTPTTHVTETTTTRQYDTSNPPVVMAPVAMTPAASSNTTTTTQFSNGTVQRTDTQPAPYAPANQSTTTTVTTEPNDGTVQKRTTTTYSAPY
jgi:hypothetical protein